MKPTMILIAPQMGENIGAAARVMKNFGLSDLRLVAPRDGWPNAKAEEMAAGAKDVIADARVFESTAEAIADVQMVYATTARSRAMDKPVIELPEFQASLGAQSARSLTPNDRRAAVAALDGDADNNSHEPPTRREREFVGDNTQKTGILFGPERSGLSNEEVVLADAVLTIPVNPDYGSLNLAQAVGIVVYQWSVASGRSSEVGGEPSLATKSDIQGLFDQLEAALDDRNFWRVGHKKEQMWLNIRNMLQRGGLTEQDVRTWRGMIRSLTER